MYDYYGIMQPHARHMTYITKKNIELVNWGGTDINVHQILYNYDQQGNKTDGLFITSFDLSAHEKGKRSNRYRGNLYIRARTSALGLWEITMQDVRIKEVGRQCFWFVYDNAVSHRVLEKPHK
jgi:hypothetical protein